MVRHRLEFHARRRLAGEGIVAQEILLTNDDRIESERARRHIHHALGRADGNRMAHSAIIRVLAHIGEDVHHGRPVGVMPVPLGCDVDDLIAFDHARSWIDRIRADRQKVAQFDAPQGAIGTESHPHLNPMISRMNVADKGLEAVCDEFDGPLEQHRDRAGGQFVAIDMGLDPVGSPNIPTDDAHRRFRQAQQTGIAVLNHVGRLVRNVDRQALIRCTVVANYRAAFEADARVSWKPERALDDHIAARKGRIDISGIDFARKADVIAQFRMDYRSRWIQRRFQAGHSCLLFIVDFDQSSCVLGKTNFRGYDRHNRLSLPAHAIDRQCGLRRGLHPFKMRQSRNHGRNRFSEVQPGVDGDDPGRFCRRCRLNSAQSRRGNGRAHEHDMQQTRQANVVDVDGGAVNEASGIGSGDGCADPGPASDGFLFLCGQGCVHEGSRVT